MKKAKEIAWESWNSKIAEIEEQEDDIELVDESEDIEIDGAAYSINPEMFLLGQSKMVHTPLGQYPNDSLLRPCNRWDCWIGHTNFDITKEIAEKIEVVDGIEALKIMGRYSFFIGVAKMFDISDVRKDIKDAICNYTEEEILSNFELQETVNLVKNQLQSSDYWSILVSPNGDVEYVSSNRLDKTYLDGLNELNNLKNKIGGIIIRGTNG